jgi:drug/metabolite transporter (DMT)-like permease
MKNHIPFVILLNYSWPTAVILCSVLLAGVKITRWWALIVGSCIVTASLGCEVLGPHGLAEDLFKNSTDILAYVIAFTGAIAWGLYSALSRKAGEQTAGSAVLPFFQLTIGLALPISFVPGFATWGNASVEGILMLMAFSFLLFMAYIAWDHGIRKGNVIILSLCADFIPWLSLVSAFFLLHVDIHNKTIFSAIILVIGAMITRYGTLPKKASVLNIQPVSHDAFE